MFRSIEIFSNQAFKLLYLLIFSTFLAPAKDNKDKLGLNNSKDISNTEHKHLYGFLKNQ
jgi:hypothetical protein